MTDAAVRAARNLPGPAVTSGSGGRQGDDLCVLPGRHSEVGCDVSAFPGSKCCSCCLFSRPFATFYFPDFSTFLFLLLWLISVFYCLSSVLHVLDWSTWLIFPLESQLFAPVCKQSGYSLAADSGPSLFIIRRSFPPSSAPSPLPPPPPSVSGCFHGWGRISHQSLVIWPSTHRARGGPLLSPLGILSAPWKHHDKNLQFSHSEKRICPKASCSGAAIRRETLPPQRAGEAGALAGASRSSEQEQAGRNSQLTAARLALVPAAHLLQTRPTSADLTLVLFIYTDYIREKAHLKRQK